MPPVRTCRHLEKWAQDPREPFRYDAEANSYFFELAGVCIPDAHCIFCGGFGMPSRAEGWPECQCGLPDQWAQNPDMPIVFDAESGEYHITRAGGYRIMYFCPACGGRMPPSHRREWFCQPSRAEMDGLSQRIKGLVTIDDVIAALGEPDERHGPGTFDELDKRIYGVKDIKRGLTYRSLAKTVKLSVQEYEDGTIRFIFAGKYIGKPSA